MVSGAGLIGIATQTIAETFNTIPYRSMSNEDLVLSSFWCLHGATKH